MIQENSSSEVFDNLSSDNFNNISYQLQRCLEEASCYTLDTSVNLGPIHFVYPLLGLIMPILTIITMISNTIIIIILSRPGMQSPTNCVLLSMAVCDLITILIPTPWYIYLYTLGHYEDAEWSTVSCFLYDLLSVTVPQIFHTASNWLTLALAVQRYIYVCHAAVAKQWCTLARSRMFVFVVLGFAVTYMMPRVFDRTYDVIHEASPSSSFVSEREICLVHFSSWAFKIVNIYFISFWWFRVVFVQIFPCISLVILNILLFSAMRRAEQRRRRLTINKTNNNFKKGGSRPTRSNTIARRMSIFGFSKESRDRRQRDANNTTMMLIVVIAVFLAVELPLSCITALHTISSSVVEFLDYRLVGNIILFINVIICLSYPLNFAIYCGMSRQFRTTFRSLFLNPVRAALCTSSGPGESGDQEGTDVMTSNKNKWLDNTSSTKMSKVMPATNNSTDNNGLLTTNL
eukprot:TRINITY_DN30708_c0_g1_i4.p1 TRINITY_DN30708_c0_g1~~TRINITY_DN30708_c0_g1_i4.p1  ORF type:complete len:460 (-),score=70.44 TRINITY_DN30708_c0_g1_i4:402-1781(-)